MAHAERQMLFPVLPIDQKPCNGCTACRHRCTAGIPLIRAEYEGLRRHLDEMNPARRDAVVCQEKVLPWPGAEGDATYTACRFYDQRSGMCLVYPVRPLVCRLFGHVPWLPCPIGEIRSTWPGGAELMQARTAEEERTYEEWEAAVPGV